MTTRLQPIQPGATALGDAPGYEHNVYTKRTQRPFSLHNVLFSLHNVLFSLHNVLFPYTTSFICNWHALYTTSGRSRSRPLSKIDQTRSIDATIWIDALPALQVRENGAHSGNAHGSGSSHARSTFKYPPSHGARGHACIESESDRMPGVGGQVQALMLSWRTNDPNSSPQRPHIPRNIPAIHLKRSHARKSRSITCRFRRRLTKRRRTTSPGAFSHDAYGLSPKP